MKRNTVRRAVTTLALALLGGSATAATMMANNSNKGSILVFPRIDIRTPAVDALSTGGLAYDTLITIVNDSSVNVQVKCYYRTSEPLPTPLSSKIDVSQIKHTMDFTFTLTRNQTLTWSAATGAQLGSTRLVAQAFGLFPDGSSRQTGELKCFAIGSDAAGNVGQINFNQLFGNAVIINSAAQAWEYNAWAFQALGGTAAQGQLVGTPGRILLDGTVTGYDMCPNILVADFQPNGGPPIPISVPPGALPGGANPVSPGGFPPGNTTVNMSLLNTGANTNVSIAGCSQDLTQVARPVITKYTYTFWNQDESSRTGTHECADSWYETYLPALIIQAQNVSTANRVGTGVGSSALNVYTGTAAPFVPANNAGISGMPLAQFTSLGTVEAYMRVESTPDPAVCFGAVQVGMLGTISHDNSFLFLRGSNMIGRGTNASGVMTWSPGPADSFKQ